MYVENDVERGSAGSKGSIRKRRLCTPIRSE
jgi:hypothetical protein